MTYNIEDDDDDQIDGSCCYRCDDLSVTPDHVHRKCIQKDDNNDTVHDDTEDGTDNEADHEEDHHPGCTHAWHFAVPWQVWFFYLNGDAQLIEMSHKSQISDTVTELLLVKKNINLKKSVKYTIVLWLIIIIIKSRPKFVLMIGEKSSWNSL